MGDLTLILSIIATIISTILAILRYKDSRKNYKRKFIVEASSSPPFKALEIQVENRGIRPITLLEYEIIYGNDYTYFTVQKDKIEPPKKMEESDVYRFEIDRTTLMNSREFNGVRQSFGCRLYIRVRASQNKMRLSPITINPKIIEKEPAIERAKPFISTDLFLGFDPMISNSGKYIRGNSSLSSGKH